MRAPWDALGRQSRPVSDDATPSAGDARAAATREVFITARDGASICAQVTTAAGPLDPDAPALLILDGIGCSGWAFRKILPVIAEDRMVVLMHYRGHGHSPEPPRPWHLGIVDSADDAAAVLEHLEVTSAVVVGFSMGFQVALELYRRHRAVVRGLVSLAGPPGRVLSTFQGTGAFAHGLPLLRAAIRQAHDLTERLWKAIVPSRWVIDLGLATQLNAERIEHEDLAFYLDQMAAMNPELFFDMLQHASRHCADDLLPEIAVPTLVVAGSRDMFVPLATMRQMAFSIPTAQWTVIEGATHALPAEYPAEIARRIAEFAATLR